MSNSRSTTAAWIAVTFLAVALPPVQGLAQTPQAAQAPGGAQGGRGGSGRPQGDYNISLRTAEEKALPNPYARDETFTAEQLLAAPDACALGIEIVAWNPATSSSPAHS